MDASFIIPTSGKIKVKYNSSVDNYFHFFIDDIEVGQSNFPSPAVTFTTSKPFVFAATNYLGNGFSRWLSITFHWFRINDIYINLDEGSGNTTTSSEGDVGEIKTSNPLGQTYIDDTMWE